MPSSTPGWQIVYTDAGFHIRFVAKNHKILVSSEVYTRRAAAVHAVEVIAGQNEVWTWVDERELVKTPRPELPTPNPPSPTPPTPPTAASRADESEMA